MVGSLLYNNIEALNNIGRTSFITGVLSTVIIYYLFRACIRYRDEAGEYCWLLHLLTLFTVSITTLHYISMYYKTVVLENSITLLSSLHNINLYTCNNHISNAIALYCIFMIISYALWLVVIHSKVRY